MSVPSTTPRSALTIAVVFTVFFPGIASAQAPARASDPVDADLLREWMADVSNTGRWGPDDELGTLNLITEAVRRDAAGLVLDGASVSMARELVAGEDVNAIQPFEHDFIVAPGAPTTWALDALGLFFHGWAYSHLDALSHAAFEGSLYNEVGRDVLVPGGGAARLGVQVMGEGIVSRGVLVDVPRLRGVDYLELGTAITVEDLEDWEAETGERIGEGDVLLIRTGRWARQEAVGVWQLTESAAGPHPSIAIWLHDRGVAALGGDGSNERYPSVVAEVPEPLHQLTLVAMGMPLFDNLDLEAVAREAAARERWTFFFVATPLQIRGASGSPVNPVAIF